MKPSVIQNPRSDDELAALEKNVNNELSGTDVKSLICSRPVVMFSKTTCAFSIELKRTLKNMGVHYDVVEADELPNIVALKESLKQISNSVTFPQLFVDGNYVGGCDDCKALDMTGELSTVLAKYLTFEKRAERDVDRLNSSRFFFFPEIANSNVAMCSGFFCVVTCVLCIAYYKKKSTPWAVLALGIDFFLRIFGGATVSPIGALSSALASFWKPRFNPGPPKQFAAVCGFFFSCFSAGLFLSDQRLGGVIILGALIFPAGLEGFLDFCLGCWMFGLGINFGLIPSSLYRTYCNMKPGRIWGYNFSHPTTKEPVAHNEHYMLPGQTVRTPADVIRKNRKETEYKLKDVHIIRNVSVDVFGAPMATAALAFMFKLSDGIVVQDGSTRVDKHTWDISKGIGIASAVVFYIFGVLYALKVIWFPKKVIKEWRHPVVGNMFAAIPITVCLYGMLIIEYDSYFGNAIIWISAIFQMLLTVDKISTLVYAPQSEDMLNASIMMGPVGNYVAALAFASFVHTKDGNLRTYPHLINYLLISRLWFAVASLFAITFFVITFRRAMYDAHSDARMRPTLWIWMAASSIAGPAYLACSGSDDVAIGKDLFFHSTWNISIFFFMINVAGIFKGFFTYCQDMSIWIYAFSTCALAMHTIMYHAYLQDTFTYVVCMFTMAIATTITGVCTAHMLTAILDQSLFTPKQKWGPVSFMKLTHEAFRFAIPNLRKMAAAVDVEKPWTVRRLVAELRPLVTTFNVHSAHEDKVLFPVARGNFPGINPGMDEDHEKLHAFVHRVEAVLANTPLATGTSSGTDAENGGAADAVSFEMQQVIADLPVWCDDVLAHLRDEEQSVTVAIRKYLPLARQREACRQCYEITDIHDWHVVIPYTLANLPVPLWKERFLRTFIWAMPERAQEIGLIVYRGVDSCLWNVLAEEIPEMIPRGLPGWRRAY